MPGRRERHEVVTTEDHRLVGERVIGNFGEGIVQAVRWCAEWGERMLGIAYEDEGIEEVMGDTELMFEWESEVEIMGES